MTSGLRRAATGALAVAIAASPALALDPRSIDGAGNNLAHPDWGRAGIALLRLAEAAYGDQVSTPGGADRPAPRVLSNRLCAQEGSHPNRAGASSMIWQWGQFLDHDIDLTPADTAEPLPIAVPAGDAHFDPEGRGDRTIGFHRSAYDPGTGTGPGNPRQQRNDITAFIDASQVYGSDLERARALRTLDGTGKMDTTGGGRFLPYNEERLDNARGPGRRLFVAGDVRANEQIGLTSLHTLFVREHNRLCDEIRAARPGRAGDEVYETARKIVGALMQVISYREFLPVLLGEDALPPYAGYDPSVNPGVTNEFSTAAYRLGHSMLPHELVRMNKPGQELVSTSLRDVFFNPILIHRGGGIEPMLRGLAVQRAEEVDGHMVDGVRNFLFGEPGEGGFDLASLNIQRGRDHGLADYNSVRRALGLARVETFADLTPDPAFAAAMQAAYGDVDRLDLWIAGLVEAHMPGAMVGETFHRILVDQFTRLRDGDRFWYRNDPFFTGDPDRLAAVEGTTLADVIRRNTKIAGEIGDNVFLLPD